MKVKELMSAIDMKYCTLHAKLPTVARVMKDSNRGALPVIDRSQKVIGIITDRDIALALEQGITASDLRVSDIVKRSKVRTITTDQPLSVALGEMRKHKIGRLPVTDKQGKLKGMLTINNILSHALEHPNEIGSVKSGDESLARTIKAIYDRDNFRPPVKQRRAPDEEFLAYMPEEE